MVMSLFLYSVMSIFFFFKQKTAYEMRISDWSSDVCSSDLAGRRANGRGIDLMAADQRLVARSGDKLDLLLWREANLGPSEISRVMDANPGLADPGPILPLGTVIIVPATADATATRVDRNSVVSGKSAEVRVELGGRSIIKKKMNNKNNN